MTSIRGSPDFDVRVVQEDEENVFSSFFFSSRDLQTNMNNATVEQRQAASHDSPYSNSAFMMFLTVIVIFVVLCYIVCLWHMVRLWICKRGVVDETSHNVVMSRRVFDLTPGQRRAVLEAIFSDTSKEVTETDVACRKEKRKKRSKNQLDGEIPKNVDVPTLKSANTFATSDGGSDHDIEEGVFDITHEPEVPALPASFVNRSSELELSSPGSMRQDAVAFSVVHDAQGQFVIEAADRLLPESLSQPIFATPGKRDDNNDDNNDTVIANDSTAVLAQPQFTTIGDVVPPPERPLLPFQARNGGNEDDDDQVPSPIFRRFPVNLAVPDLREEHRIPLPPLSSSGVAIVQHGAIEESKEEEKTEEDDMRLRGSSRALLSEPITFTRVESVGSAFTSEFDDETEDNVCPICLNSYHEGDILIASKHCSHIFHRDCILEWLEKHDSCPVCRVDMVTEGEMNQAATSIVGRTRMYVAMESITRSPRHHHHYHHHGPNSTAHRHVLPAHRHIIAAPQTPPASPPRHLRVGHLSR